ncbi:MAG: hypothetical protein ABI847_04735, partial [Anaerolineales bacterium]
MKKLTHFAELGLVLAAASLTAIWLSLWVSWIVRLAVPGRALPLFWPPLLAVAGVAGAGATRWALARPQWSRRQSRGLISLAGVLTVLLVAALALEPALWFGDWREGPHVLSLLALAGPAAAAAFYMWLSGIHLGRDTISHHTFSGAFSSGLLALGLILAANAIIPVVPGGDLLAASLLFFGLGLAGLAFGSLRRLSLSQRAVALAQVALHRDWLVTAAVVIGLVLLTGLALASLLAPETFGRMMRAFGAVADAAGIVAALIIAPLALATMALLEPWMGSLSRLLLGALEILRSVLLKLSSLLGIILQLMTGRSQSNAIVQKLEAFLASPAVQGTGRWASFAGLLLVLAIIFWFAARRLIRLRAVDEDEERESILSGDLLWAQLRRLFRR